MAEEAVSAEGLVAEFMPLSYMYHQLQLDQVNIEHRSHRVGAETERTGNLKEELARLKMELFRGPHIHGRNEATTH